MYGGLSDILWKY